MMGAFSIFFLLLHFFLLGTIFAISSKAGSICAFSKIHQGSLLYFAIDGILEMWKREGKLFQERRRLMMIWWVRHEKKMDNNNDQ
jgi:hypothetical protein